LAARQKVGAEGDGVLRRAALRQLAQVGDRVVVGRIGGDVVLRLRKRLEQFACRVEAKPACHLDPPVAVSRSNPAGCQLIVTTAPLLSIVPDAVWSTMVPLVESEPVDSTVMAATALTVMFTPSMLMVPSFFIVI